MDEFVIQTDGLTKRYKNVVAVDDLSMEVRRGRVYGQHGGNYSHHNCSTFAQGIAMCATPLRPLCFTRRRSLVRVQYCPPLFETRCPTLAHPLLFADPFFQLIPEWRFQYLFVYAPCYVI